MHNDRRMVMSVKWLTIHGDADLQGALSIYSGVSLVTFYNMVRIC